jgi:hypothetical protein
LQYFFNLLQIPDLEVLLPIFDGLMFFAIACVRRVAQVPVSTESHSPSLLQNLPPPPQTFYCNGDIVAVAYRARALGLASTHGVY